MFVRTYAASPCMGFFSNDSTKSFMSALKDLYLFARIFASLSKCGVVFTSKLIKKCVCALGWLFTSFDSFHFIQALSYSSGYFFFYGHWHQFKITDT